MTITFSFMLRPFHVFATTGSRRHEFLGSGNESHNKTLDLVATSVIIPTKIMINKIPRLMNG